MSLRIETIVRLVLICLVAGVLMPISARGQFALENTFIELQLQSNQYTGDRGLSGGGGLGLLVDRFGPGGALSFGYAWNPRFDIGVRLGRGTYPGILANSKGRPSIDSGTSSPSRTTFSVLGRYFVAPNRRVNPYVILGAGTAFGKINSVTKSGTGPIVGIGATYSLFGMLFFSSLEQHYIYPNHALDLAGSDPSPDALTAVSWGVRYTFGQKSPKLGHVVVTGPSTLDQASSGMFRIDIEPIPVDAEVTWFFGDGMSDTGPIVQHAYAVPGQYQVQVSVINPREKIDRFLQVDVKRSFAPVEIVAIVQTPRQASVGKSIGFSPRIRGDDYTCMWSFGDGTEAQTCDVRHVFNQPGVFGVDLHVSNPAHSARSTRMVDVRDNACLDLPPLHSVFFEFNSSTLGTEMRSLLRENFSTSSACPDFVLVVKGGAHADEPRPEQLARERASVVLQYYLNLGMSSRSIAASDDVIIREQREGELAWPLRLATSALQSNQDR